MPVKPSPGSAQKRRAERERTALLLNATVIALRAWIRADLARQDREEKLQDARELTAALAELDPEFAEARRLTGRAVNAGLIRHGRPPNLLLPVTTGIP